MIGHTSAKDVAFKFKGVGGMLPRKKFEIEILKLLEMHLNCQSYHHHVILYHFKYFTIPSGGPFWPLKACCIGPLPADLDGYQTFHKFEKLSFLS